jgi:DnaJ family protein C protein 28
MRLRPSVKMEKPERPRDWESWIDQQIREAQERGAFDNLPGKGKPIDLSPNPYALDQELVFKILKDAGFSPEWIELDKAIRGKLERARTVLTRRWAWHQARLDELSGRTDAWARAEKDRSLAGWRDAVSAFEEEVEAINAEIADLNLKVPSPRFQRSKVHASREIERLTEGQRE